MQREWDEVPGDIQVVASKIVKKIERRERLYTEVRDQVREEARYEVDQQRGDDDWAEWIKNYAWAQDGAEKELADATGYRQIVLRAEAAACDVYMQEGARPLAYGETATDKAREDDRMRYGRAYRAARDVYVPTCREALANYTRQ